MITILLLKQCIVLPRVVSRLSACSIIVSRFDIKSLLHNLLCVSWYLNHFLLRLANVNRNIGDLHFRDNPHFTVIATGLRCMALSSILSVSFIFGACLSFFSILQRLFEKSSVITQHLTRLAIIAWSVIAICCTALLLHRQPFPLRFSPLCHQSI